MKRINNYLRAHFRALGAVHSRNDFPEIISRCTASDSGPITVEGAMAHLDSTRVRLWGDRDKARTVILRTALTGDAARLGRETYVLHVRDDLVRIVVVK